MMSEINSHRDYCAKESLKKHDVADYYSLKRGWVAWGIFAGSLTLAFIELTSY